MTSLCFSRAVAAIALSTLLAACGGGGSAPASPPSNPAPPVEPALKYPIPASAWSAPAGATPGAGNYIYLQSDSGDYVGGGRTYNYADANARMSVSGGGLSMTVNVQGNQNWNGGFLLPSAAGNLQAGYFQGLTRTAFADKAVGGVEWSGEGRGCNIIQGWLIIDKVSVTAGVMDAVDLRFEQHCEGGSSALRGQIHWSKAAENSVPPPGPQAIPANLWQPAAGAVPGSGNYLYLESRTGDYIGAGKTYSYAPANALLTVTAAGAHLGVGVAGDQNWTGDFLGMQGLPQLTAGYYSGLMRYPFNNPVLGGLNWSGDGRGCNQLSGWFAVDKITYSGGALTAVDLRFEQYCDASTVPLHGQLHWVAGDASTPAPGPQNPPPAGLWKPDAGFTPPAGNYVYLVSSPGDYIGLGRTEFFNSSNATINVDPNRTAALGISVGGWSGDFIGMSSLSQLKPGYYGDLQRYPFNNAIKGGMNWSGNGRGCNTLTGWFVVDQASYSLGALTSIDLRFEQHCEGAQAAQHGVIHWSK